LECASLDDAALARLIATILKAMENPTDAMLLAYCRRFRSEGQWGDETPSIARNLTEAHDVWQTFIVAARTGSADPIN
jgi:hypothetical protein